MGLQVFMYAVVMFMLYILYGRVMAFFTSAQDFFVSNSQNKKFKNPLSPEPFVSRAKAPPAKGRTIRKLMWEGGGGGGIFDLQEFLFGPVPVQEFFFDCSPMYDVFSF